MSSTVWKGTYFAAKKPKKAETQENRLTYL